MTTARVLPRYLNAIDEVLKSYSKPVDQSILEQELNRSLASSYSMHFYSFIARLFAEEKVAIVRIYYTQQTQLNIRV